MTDADANTITLYSYAGVAETTIHGQYPGGYPGTEYVRNVAEAPDGSLWLFNGTFYPYISNVSSNGTSWRHFAHDQFQIENNGSYGGIALFGSYVFVSNDLGGSFAVVRVDTGSWATTTFGSGGSSTLNMGQDGLLYSLNNQTPVVAVYNPASEALVRTVTLTGSNQYDFRGVAVLADGHLIIGTWGGYIQEYNSDGTFVKQMLLGNAAIGGSAEINNVSIGTDGSYLVGSRFGDVYVVNSTLTSYTQFNAGNNFDGVFANAALPPFLSVAPSPQTATYRAAFSWIVPSNTFTDAPFTSPLTYSATDLPPGLIFDPVNGTLSGTPTATGTFNVQITAADNNTPPRTVAAPLTLTVGKAATTISFPPIGSVSVGMSVPLSAMASSGLPVTFAVTGGNAVILSGNVLTVNDINPVTITAQQSGDSNYAAAVGTSQTITSKPGVARVAIGQNSGAIFAVYVNSSGTGGELLTVFPASGVALASALTITGGSFLGTAVALTGGASLGQAMTVTGSISNGAVSGTVGPAIATFSAPLDPVSGATAGFAGLYHASNETASLLVYAIAGPQNDVFVMATAPGIVTASTGTLVTGNTFSLTTGQATAITGSIDPSTLNLTGSVTPAGAGALAYLGTSSVNDPSATPAFQTVQCGGQATLTVASGGSGASYQWLYNGAALAGATKPTLVLSNVGATQAGSYSANVTSGGITRPSTTATVHVTSNAWLANLSARALIAPSSNPAATLTAGFVIVGPRSKSVLVRAPGPVLRSLGISNALQDPALTLYSSTAQIDSALSWNPALAGLFASLGAFPFPPGSGNPAIQQSFSGGAYTCIVGPADGSSQGVALAELYDADSLAPAVRLVNVSSKAYAGTGSAALVGGFVISGTTSETVLIRGVGPRLAGSPFSIPNVLPTPVLTLYDTNSGNPQAIATVQGWNTVPIRGPSTVNAGLALADAAVMNSVRAFALVPGSADSAMVATLPPGAYTATVSDASGLSGVAIVEIYEVQ